MAVDARFEFRAWARNFAVVEDRIRRLSPCQDIRESTEVYYVSAGASGINIKMRNGALDTKVLVDTRDGLEQWHPRSNVPFPVPIDTLKQDVFGALGVAAPALERAAYSADQILDEVLRPHSAIVTVNVFKRRFSFTIFETMVELAQVNINGAGLETIAIESVDATKITECRHLLGLDDFWNVNYPRLIQHVIGMNPLPGGFQEGADLGQGN